MPPTFSITCKFKQIITASRGRVSLFSMWLWSSSAKITLPPVSKLSQTDLLLCLMSWYSCTYYIGGENKFQSYPECKILGPVRGAFKNFWQVVLTFWERINYSLSHWHHQTFCCAYKMNSTVSAVGKLYSLDSLLYKSTTHQISDLSTT